MTNLINRALVAEKRLFYLILAGMTVIGFCGCKNNISPSNNEVERSSKYVWSYLSQNKNTVEEALQKTGWEQNYSGKSDNHLPVVLYVYNRPNQNWGPCHFKKYAYSGQKMDSDELEAVIKKGDSYGELYVIYRDNIVSELGLFWLMPSAQGEDMYQTSSTNIYKSFVADGGEYTSWSGSINSSTYKNHQAFIEALKSYSKPSTDEYGTCNSSALTGSYELYSAYDYYLHNSFYMCFKGYKE